MTQDAIKVRLTATVIDESGLGLCPPKPRPLCRIVGEVIFAILGDRDMEDADPCGWLCEVGDGGGKVDEMGDLYALL